VHSRPALATTAATISALFQDRDSGLRRALTVEALRCEFHLFDTRTGKGYQSPTPDDEALNQFIKRTERLYKGERSDWASSRSSDNPDA
jgi:hypothetical protein